MDMTNYHIKFGIHSNIPDCCIYFFLTTWNNWATDKLLDQEYRRAMWMIGGNAEYVICPNCLLIGNIKKIHRCYPGCGFNVEDELRRAEV